MSIDILPNCSKIDKLSPKNARPERISRPCSNLKNTKFVKYSVDERIKSRER